MNPFGKEVEKHLADVSEFFAKLKQKKKFS